MHSKIGLFIFLQCFQFAQPFYEIPNNHVKKQLSRRVCLRSDYLRQAKWKLKVNTEWLKTTRTSGSTYADAGPSFKR